LPPLPAWTCMRAWSTNAIIIKKGDGHFYFCAHHLLSKSRIKVSVTFF
jgi:hypothetical protein